MRWRPRSRDRVIILGSGPNRIGQGIEFDYCCVHASMALRDMGYETVMVNCNPETVSTDYSTSDRLYFEPLTPEDLAEVIAAEQAACVDGARFVGVIVSLGGQTPLKLSHSIDPDLVLGTPVRSIDAAEDRERWSAICASLGLRQPPGDVALTLAEARAIAKRVGYPVLVRPSYVLGGRAMEIVYDDAALERVMDDLTSAHGSLAREGGVSKTRPILLDSFLEDAIEVDVDAVRDASGDIFVAGVMEHVEEAGVHSGDSACALPPQTLSDGGARDAAPTTRAKIADALEVVGLINVQYAVKNDEVFVLEANPRASRTVPFVAKATGVPLAQVAVRVMMGETLAHLRDDRGGAGDDPAAELRQRERGGPALQSLSRRRHGARSRDALDRRGHGHRRELRHRLRQVPARGGHAAARQRTGLLLPGRPRQGRGSRARPRSSRELGFRLAATVGTAGFLRSHGVASTRWWARSDSVTSAATR